MTLKVAVREHAVVTYIDPEAAWLEDVVDGFHVLDDVVGCVDEERARHTIP